MITEYSIKKHVALIHAHSLMTALQRKAVNALLVEAKQEKNSISNESSAYVECCIPLSNIVKAVGFKSNNIQYLKESIDGLASLTIEWNLLKDKVPSNISFLNLRILHGSPTFYHDGIMNFSFHKVMLDLVSDPSVYGLIDLQIQAQYESKYAHALYENSTRFEHLGKNKIIQLDVFRKLLGVKEEVYPSMQEFTRNVIKPAIEEVNDRAGFVVNLEKFRAGRKIVAFELSVKTKASKKENQDNIEKQDNNSEIVEAIEKYFINLNKKVLNSIITDYEKDYILEKIAYTKEHAKKESTGYYPIAYFISALKNDYRSGDSNYLSKKNEPKLNREEKEWREKSYKLQQEIHHWRKQYECYSCDDAYQRMLVLEKELKQHVLNKPFNDGV